MGGRCGTYGTDVKRILSTFRRSERNDAFFMWWMAVSCRTHRIATLSCSANIIGASVSHVQSTQ